VRRLTSDVPGPRDHRAWAAWWGGECLRAIERAVETPNPTTVEDLHMNHAVRSARAAWGHICALARQRTGVPNRE
jgi:hypothetical protein